MRLNVLLIMDSAEDATKIINELSRGGYKPVVLLTGTENELKQAFERKRWDLVISDYSMAQFSGRDALKLYKAYNLTMPFIMVSRINDEARAVDSLRSGAHDFVSKSNLSRLVPAVQRELKDAHIRQDLIESRQNLRESEALFTTLTGTMAEGAAIIDLEERFVYSNERLDAIFGSYPGGLIGRSMLEFLLPESQEIVQQQTEGRRRGIRSSYEVEIVREDQSRCFVLINASPIYDGKGEIVNFFAIFLDMTLRKKAEEALLVSEEKYRQLYVSSMDAIMLLNLDAGFTGGNPATLSMFGCENETEFMTFSIADLSPEHQLDGRLSDEKASEMMMTAIENGSHTYEWLHRRTDNKEFYTSVLLTRLGDANSRNLQATIRDITSKKKLENNLKRNIQILELTNTLQEISLTDSGLAVQLQMALDSILSLSWLPTEPKGAIFVVAGGDNQLEMIVSSNLSTEIQTACSRLSFGQCLCGRAALEGMIQFAEHVDARHDICYPGMRDHGHYNVPIKSDGKVIGVIVLYLRPGHVRKSEELVYLQLAANTLAGMITHNRSVMALKNSEKRLRTITDTAKDAIVMMDNEGKISFWNSSAEEIFGYRQNEVLGKNLHKILISEDQIEVFTERFRNYEQTGDGELIGKTIEMEAINKNGAHFPVELSLSSIQIENAWHSVGVIRDISKRKQFEIQLQHLQKMEAVGTLAAGVAHEINTPTQYVGNNIRFLEDGFKDFLKIFELVKSLKISAADPVALKGIIGNIQATSEEIDLDYLIDEIPEALQQTMGGIQTITRIVGAMRSFAHPGTGEKTLTDINQAIDSTITVSRSEWKYVAELTTEFSPDLPLVHCFPGEFNQVVLNMIVNSVHAIMEKQEAAKAAAEAGAEDHTVTDRISIVTRDGENFIEIEISDTGSGIPSQIQDRIFDPFFTTKDVGKGTGQGLAIAYNVVVEKHNGEISVDSEIGKGSKFTIKLPKDAE